MLPIINYFTVIYIILGQIKLTNKKTLFLFLLANKFKTTIAKMSLNVLAN